MIRRSLPHRPTHRAACCLATLALLPACGSDASAPAAAALPRAGAYAVRTINTVPLPITVQRGSAPSGGGQIASWTRQLTAVTLQVDAGGAADLVRVQMQRFDASGQVIGEFRDTTHLRFGTLSVCEQPCGAGYFNVPYSTAGDTVRFPFENVGLVTGTPTYTFVRLFGG